MAAGDRVVLDGLDLRVPAGEVTALVGPSGAGKTTLLRAVAGLTTVRRGAVRLDEADITAAPAAARGIGVVFQEPRLFPHADVGDNVSFGLRTRGVGRAERRRVADNLLDAVGLTGFTDRRIRSLSGGEQQRVNLARALALRPRLLLLDEPLSAVDPSARADLAALLRDVRHRFGITTVHVTHDLEEATATGDTVAVLVSGHLVQHAPPREVHDRPATATVARLTGNPNLLTGTVQAGVLTTPGGELRIDGPDGPATVTVRPERWVVAPDGGTGLQGEVTDTAYRGRTTRLSVTTAAGTIVVDVDPDDAPALGRTIVLTTTADHVHRLGGTT